jgi:hypothetical protein
MTERQMFELSFQRPSYFFKLSAEEQWAIDKQLGILDWDGKDLSEDDMIRFHDHYTSGYTDIVNYNSGKDSNK